MSEFLPQVSVIVPIYNGEADLPDLLACLRSQTYPRDRVEYLLVDNNSSDKTSEILKSAAETAKADGLNLQALSEAQIQSSYAARNLAIGCAIGDILAFTDADCRPEPQWLAEIVKPFADPSIGIVVGELAALHGDSLLEQYAERTQMMSQHFLVEHPFCPYGQTANLAVRRVAFTQVGLFRPYLTTGGDADICWRIQRGTDWKLTTAPQATIRHRHRNSFRELRSQWRRYGVSNRYLHELHGIALMRELTPKEAAYRLSRWLFKELPRDTVKLLRGKAAAIDLLRSPIDLVGHQARSYGQKTAKLPEEAKEIVWLKPKSGFNQS